MAISTAITTLLYSADEGTTYTKLVDIKSYPDLGGSPSRLDTTDLSAEKFKTNILGLQETPDFTFEANFDSASYVAIEALAGSVYPFKIEFGDNGEFGAFTWDGQVTVYANGGGVDEVRSMTIDISAETEVVFVPAT